VQQQPKRPGFSADASHDWPNTKERIGQQLKLYYEAYTSEELPPRLLALIKKLDEEIEPTPGHPAIIRDVES
jgi:hypothetical protein